MESYIKIHSYHWYERIRQNIRGCLNSGALTVIVNNKSIKNFRDIIAIVITVFEELQ